MDGKPLCTAAGRGRSTGRLDGWKGVTGSAFSGLARVLENIPTDMAGLDEWNDTLVYLGRDPPEKDGGGRKGAADPNTILFETDM